MNLPYKRYIYKLMNQPVNQAAVEDLEKQEVIGDLEFLRKLSVMKVLIVDDKRNMNKTIENMLASICSFKRKSESVFRASDGNVKSFMKKEREI